MNQHKCHNQCQPQIFFPCQISIRRQSKLMNAHIPVADHANPPEQILLLNLQLLDRIHAVPQSRPALPQSRAASCHRHQVTQNDCQQQEFRCSVWLKMLSFFFHSPIPTVSAIVFFNGFFKLCLVKIRPRHISKIKFRIRKLPHTDNWKAAALRWYGSEDPDPGFLLYPDGQQIVSSVISSGSRFLPATIFFTARADLIPASIVNGNRKIQSVLILRLFLQLCNAVPGYPLPVRSYLRSRGLAYDSSSLS